MEHSMQTKTSKSHINKKEGRQKDRLKKSWIWRMKAYTFNISNWRLNHQWCDENPVVPMVLQQYPAFEVPKHWLCFEGLMMDIWRLWYDGKNSVIETPNGLIMHPSKIQPLKESTYSPYFLLEEKASHYVKRRINQQNDCGRFFIHVTSKEIESDSP